MVMDLNKCLGCQTCTIACKKLWTDRDGSSYMYWNNVETRPGQATRAVGSDRRRLEGWPTAAQPTAHEGRLRRPLGIQLRTAAL